MIRCKANPFDLVCECKGSRKIGICAHILAVTHCWVKEGNEDEQRRLAFCNLRLMTQALTTKTKKGAKWMKGKGATKILHYLYKEVPKEVDSSDDEEDVSFIPPLKYPSSGERCLYGIREPLTLRSASLTRLILHERT